jgi:hypothetical protein
MGPCLFIDVMVELVSEERSRGAQILQSKLCLQGSLHLVYFQYIQKVLPAFGMESCQPKSTPMNTKQSLNHRPDERNIRSCANHQIH